MTFSIHGGWTPFGPERIVTKSQSNILYELDNQPALDLYKKYLGEKAKELPGAALLYPLKLKSVDEKQSIVRTILNINEEEHAAESIARILRYGSKTEPEKVEMPAEGGETPPADETIPEEGGEEAAAAPPPQGEEEVPAD